MTLRKKIHKLKLSVVSDSVDQNQNQNKNKNKNKNKTQTKFFLVCLFCCTRTVHEMTEDFFT